ncbi:MAG: hypothetical protein KAY24_02235, partial [Candidatus Eisenbacteria sp.]|nr:hypothetical protein [Candidatus Eisenbacteria bacterium]
MIIQLLIKIALVVVPLILVAGQDTRGPQMEMAVGASLIIALVAIRYGKLRPFRNKWLLLFVGYLLVNRHFAPTPLAFAAGNVPNFWIWKPVFYVIVFVMMIVTLASLRFTEEHKQKLLNVMAWVGLVMSAYTVVQWIGIDQFAIKLGSKNLMGVVGTLGNRILVAPFIAMLIPIALYMRRWWQAILMTLAVLVTRSQMGIGSLVVGLIIWVG